MITTHHGQGSKLLDLFDRLGGSFLEGNAVDLSILQHINQSSAQCLKGHNLDFTKLVHCPRWTIVGGDSVSTYSLV